MVLMLADTGKEGVWVPYLGSAFVLEDSRMLLGDHPAEKLGLPDEAEAPTEVSLDEVRRIVDDAARVRSDEGFRSILPPLPPVTEQPDGLPAAGRSGAPQPSPIDEPTA
jgi:hypothetical protein